MSFTKYNHLPKTVPKVPIRGNAAGAGLPASLPRALFHPSENAARMSSACRYHGVSSFLWVNSSTWR